MSKWNYDKLFAVGNLLGIKNKEQNKIYWHSIEFGDYGTNTKHSYIQIYGNEKLSCAKNNNYEIAYIISLNDDGTVKEHIFDRERDMAKPMPKLETGMFIEVKVDREIEFIGVIVGNVVIYEDGGFDTLNEMLSVQDADYYVSKVYAPTNAGFESITNCEPIWVNKEYNKGEN